MALLAARGIIQQMQPKVAISMGTEWVLEEVRFHRKSDLKDERERCLRDFPLVHNAPGAID